MLLSDTLIFICQIQHELHAHESRPLAFDQAPSRIDRKIDPKRDLNC